MTRSRVVCDDCFKTLRQRAEEVAQGGIFDGKTDCTECHRTITPENICHWIRVTSNYHQVLTPPDECAKHGKEHMLVALHKRSNVLYVNGEKRSEGEPYYVCEACLLADIENRRKRECAHVIPDAEQGESCDLVLGLEAERDVLVKILADLFSWEDRSYLHAVMHVENAVNNLRANLAVERRRIERALKAAEDGFNPDWFGNSLAEQVRKALTED